MKRDTIVEKIFKASKRAKFNAQYTYGEVKTMLKKKNIKLLDTDVLEICYDEGFDHGDSSCEASFNVTVQRIRPETDEELTFRKELQLLRQKNTKEAQYATYLRLKKEFEV